MAPTASNFKIRFDAFADTSDTAIEFALEEAAKNVDATWRTEDQDMGVMYLAAHFLATAEQYGPSGGRGVVSESIGRISVRYELRTPEGITSLNSTYYGQRYLDLLKANKPSIVAI